MGTGSSFLAHEVETKNDRTFTPAHRKHVPTNQAAAASQLGLSLSPTVKLTLTVTLTLKLTVTQIYRTLWKIFKKRKKNQYHSREAEPVTYAVQSEH